jgi:predicted RNA-binding protein YlxR (DUF448 family)
VALLASPLRECVNNRRLLPSAFMLRFAAVYDRSTDSLTITADHGHRMKARGLWAKADQDTVKKTHKKNNFANVLHHKIHLPPFELFMKEIETDLKATILVNFKKAMDEENKKETITHNSEIDTSSSILQSSIVELIQKQVIPSEQVIQTIVPQFDLTKLPSSSYSIDMVINLHRLQQLT